VCFESLRNVFVSSDNHFGFKKCGLSSSHAIYTVKYDVNEYYGIFSGSLLYTAAWNESTNATSDVENKNALPSR